MLISSSHKFLFVHVPKAAGQSVVNALMPFAARKYQKVISPVVSYRWQLKANSALKRYCGIYLQPQPFADHARACEIAEKMGIGEFSSYYSFTFVRNPWDRLLSIYTYTLQNKRHYRHKLLLPFSDFNDFVEWHCTEDKLPLQSDLIFARDGSQLINFIGKFENIEGDFKAVCNHVGISPVLPKFNVSNQLAYRDVYTSKSKELVYGVYKDDIDKFNYSF